MLHLPNTDLMAAMTRHHADGRPKDGHEIHRRDHILRRRLARRMALLALLRKVGIAARSLLSAGRAAGGAQAFKR